MGMASSHIAEPPLTKDGPYAHISTGSPNFRKLNLTEMAATMDNQMQDDLSHDTLMGLQELDSHLAIFETGPDRETSTPMSSVTFDETVKIPEPPAHSIYVSSPDAGRFQSYQSPYASRARPPDKKQILLMTQYVSSTHEQLISHDECSNEKPGSASD